MTIDLNQFIKNIQKIDTRDICSDWQWLLEDKYDPIMVTCSGDMFLTDTSGAVYWLDTGIGQLIRIAESTDKFIEALEDIDNFDKWMLASTVLDLIENDVLLKENQVYSYKVMPILNGSYSMDNFDTTDISVHFSITGQICQQIIKPHNGMPLPDGTRIDKVLIDPFTKTSKLKFF